MAVNAPDKIQVTLGSKWQASPSLGNLLHQGEVITLTRDGTTAFWYEDENGSPVANSTSNRIKLKLTNLGTQFLANVQLCQSGTNSWYYSTGIPSYGVATFFANGAGIGYNFKDLWAGGNPSPVAPGFPSTPSAVGYYNQTTFAGPSFIGAKVNGYGTYGQYPTYLANYKLIFSTMEDATPETIGPDKTTYRYG